MKTILVTVILLFILCIEVNLHASSNKYFSFRNSIRQDSINYKVYKIDSINNYYLIYAKKGHDLFKVVSKKERIKMCNSIIVNNVYEFHLHSILSINGHPIIPANEIMELSGFMIDHSTVIRFEGDSIRDLYYADNIKGLCFIKKK